ncbi:MAG: hypothetical protein AVDCRST_MAG69-1917, partial [uncultured Solirubrobacteraceae bacterium]
EATRLGGSALAGLRLARPRPPSDHPAGLAGGRRAGDHESARNGGERDRRPRGRG